MAQIDKADLGDGVLRLHVNVSSIVGIGGTNEKNDVMLVQALFGLLGYTDEQARFYFKLRKNDLPEPTGNFWDNKTAHAIWKFQTTNALHLLSLDGKIHPANYKNRVIKHSDGRVMAITFLNIYVIDTALIAFNGEDIIPVLKKFAPELLLRPFDPWA